MTATPPLVPLLLGLGLLAVSVVIHALTVALLFRWFHRIHLPPTHTFIHAAWILVRVAWWTVLAHLLEVAVWAMAFVKIGALPDLDTAAYFSLVTYTTVGYGDVLLPAGWHVLAGIEGLTGILMAGWSTGVLFGVVSRMVAGLDRSRTGHGSEAP